MSRQLTLGIVTAVQGIEHQTARQLALQGQSLLFSNLTTHQQGQPSPVKIMIVDLIISFGLDVPARFRQGIQAGPCPVDHKSAVGFFKLTKLQRNLISHHILRHRLAMAVDNHPPRRRNLERDRSRVSPRHNRTIRWPLRHRADLRRRTLFRLSMSRRNKPQAAEQPSFQNQCAGHQNPTKLTPLQPACNAQS